ncbi:acyltransferase family protein [Chitinimonas sp. BJYL2]|uniref:acyltransferase family protein n=1 Tax=Chitinimonas sp. BJYL2 TaxID=2976696 RepID=UPI0022B3A11B|nr:heparan-alpha-glucosaminide N-acetyltransferase domain-containing protein [Chitinimonas sp. BJYL2]
MDDRQRLLSLDVFRGFTIAAMLLVNNPGSWSSVYSPLLHAEWHGWTFTDLIFPFFLFIGGVAMSLSLGKRQADSRFGVLLQCWRRAALIIAIGLFLNLFPMFNFAEVRIPGVLQRIGLVVALAAPVVIYLRLRGQLLVAMAALLVYSVLMRYGQVCDLPGGCFNSEPLPGRDFGAWVDRALMEGHLWAKVKTWDPEGLLSTLPALVTQLIGVWAGRLIALQTSVAERCTWLFVAGVTLLLAGTALDLAHLPINKSLWTPAYAVFMGGWGCLGLACCYWLLDGQPSARARQWLARACFPLTMLGMNALFIFALSGMVGRLLGTIKIGPDSAPVSLKAWLYAPVEHSGLAPENASLMFALLFTLVMLGVAWAMWRKRWFIKL